MTFQLILGTLALIFFYVFEVNAHGRLLEPVSRSSAWRKGFDTPINYNDNELFCGGFAIQYYQNDGNCGPCGDDYAKSRPRDNENGGLYGTGTIVRRYSPGQTINITVQITANHMGYFEFSLCPLNSTMDLESEECFDTYPLPLDNGDYDYPIVDGTRLGNYDMRVVLPDDLSCEHCVLRWHYTCGNNWGICEDGTGQLGCGFQENFRGCADVSILK